MRKITGLTIAVVLIIGLVGGGTWAYFSDIETAPPPATQVCAVSVVDYEQGLRADGSAVLPARSNPNSALDAPDGVFFSLGFGGWIELDMGTDICGDITIWEITGGEYPLEEATVEVSGSPDGVNWEYIGTATNQENMPANTSHSTTLNLGDAHVRYVRITDVTDTTLDWPANADAFDLDAVCGWTCENDMFRAGIIDLELEGSGTMIVEGNLTDIKPCQTGYLVIVLRATEDSNPMDVWKHIVTIEEENRDENGVTEAECKACGGEWDAATGECANYTPKNDIDRYIHFDMWIDSNYDPDVEVLPSFDVGTADVMLIDESEGWLLTNNLINFDPVDDYGINGVSCHWIYLGTLQPGETMVIVQSFHLDGSVANWAQSDSLTFTEEFYAQQIVGNAPSPDPELPGHGKPQD